MCGVLRVGVLLLFQYIKTTLISVNGNNIRGGRSRTFSDRRIIVTKPRKGVPAFGSARVGRGGGGRNNNNFRSVCIIDDAVKFKRARPHHPKIVRANAADDGLYAGHFHFLDPRHPKNFEIPAEIAGIIRIHYPEIKLFSQVRARRTQFRRYAAKYFILISVTLLYPLTFRSRLI